MNYIKKDQQFNPYFVTILGIQGIQVKVDVNIWYAQVLVILNTVK